MKYRKRSLRGFTIGYFNKVDSFELSRPKKNISRDFSDGCLVAEIIHFYHPSIVQLVNYYKTNKKETKKENWNLLKTRVFPKIQISISDELIEEIIDTKYMSIEAFLIGLKINLETAYVEKPRFKIPKLEKQNKMNQINEYIKYNNKEMDFKKEETNRFLSEQVEDLKETVKMLERKVTKLNDIIKIKDDKIKILEKRLFENFNKV